MTGSLCLHLIMIASLAFQFICTHYPGPLKKEVRAGRGRMAGPLKLLRIMQYITFQISPGGHNRYRSEDEHLIFGLENLCTHHPRPLKLMEIK